MTKIKNRMPKKYKNKWIKALRSGKYKQGVGLLHDKKRDAYCCLGVLQHCLMGKVETDEYDESFRVPSSEWVASKGITWLDIMGEYQPYPTLIWKNIPTMAFRLNDNNKLSFEVIADLIEEQIEGY